MYIITRATQRRGTSMNGQPVKGSSEFRPAVSEDIFHFLFATAPRWKLGGNLCLRPGRLLPETALA